MINLKSIKFGKYMNKRLIGLFLLFFFSSSNTFHLNKFLKVVPVVSAGLYATSKTHCNIAHAEQKQEEKPMPHECEEYMKRVMEGESLFFMHILKGCAEVRLDGKVKKTSELVNYKNKKGEIVWHQSIWNDWCRHNFKEYLERGADVNVQDDQGRMSLHYVRDVATAQLLFDKGAKVDVKDNNGQTPLSVAGNAQVALFFLNNKADIHACSSKGLTVLHNGCLWDNIELVQRAINSKLDVNARDESQSTPLHYAGSLEVAQLLLDNGADLNACDGQGKNPLYETKSRKVALFLLDHGAIIKGHDSLGRTFLHKAAEWGDLELVKRAIAAGEDVNEQWINLNERRKNEGTALMLAKNREVALFLLDHGADLKVCNEYKQTFLHQAVSYFNDVELVQRAIQLGADVNARSVAGYAPLHMVQSFAVTEELLKNGADPLIRTNNGETVFDRTIDKKTEQCLLDTIAKIEEEKKVYGQLLQNAVWQGNRSEVERLLNTKNGKVCTTSVAEALCTAIVREDDSFSEAMVEICSKNGVDTDYMSTDIGRPLINALYHEKMLTAAALMRNGAEINKSMNAEKLFTALEYAVYYGRLKSTQFCLQNGAYVGGVCDRYGHKLLVQNESNKRIAESFIAYEGSRTPEYVKYEAIRQLLTEAMIKESVKVGCPFSGILG